MSLPNPPARLIVKRTSRVIFSLGTTRPSNRVIGHPGLATVKPNVASEVSTIPASPAPLPSIPTAEPANVTTRADESVAAMQAQWRELLTDLLTLAETLRGVVHAASIPAVQDGTQDPAPAKSKRKYTPRKTDEKVDPLPLTERKWITIKQAAAMYPKTEQAFRHLIYQCGQRLKYPKAGLPSNGFEKCFQREQGSRKVNLNVEELDRWFANDGEGAQ